MKNVCSDLYRLCASLLLLVLTSLLNWAHFSLKKSHVGSSPTSLKMAYKKRRMSCGLGERRRTSGREKAEEKRLEEEREK
jgi:hypothetical protein